MKTILRKLFLTALVSALPVNGLMASEQTDLPGIQSDVADSCVRESRRPIADVISGRCTEDEGPSYFALIQPECNCVLERSHDGLPVLRLQRGFENLNGEVRTTFKPAVFRAESRDRNARAYAI